MSEVNLVRKLSTKTIIGSRIRMNDGEDERYLFRLAGRVTGIQTGNSDFGPWVAFKGNFQAQRADGQIFAAPKCFVPEPVQSMLEDKVQSQLADGMVPSIQFGIDVYAEADDSAAVGYQFKVVPVLKPEDETDSLLSQLNASKPLPALAAPEADVETEAKPAAKKKAAARK